MRHFHKLYFAGSGNQHDQYLSHPKKKMREQYRCDYPDAQYSYSFMMRQTLEMLLANALSTLSGMQQGGCQSDEEYEKCKMDLKDTVRDLAVAITGEDIEFVGENESNKRNLDDVNIAEFNRKD